MNISTQLAHFDERLAICAATLQDGESRFSVYASALAGETGRYADLAQQRAVDLALKLHEQGGEAIREMAFSVQPVAPDRPGPAPVDRPIAPVEESPAILPAESSQPAPADLPGNIDESDIAPW